MILIFNYDFYLLTTLHLVAAMLPLGQIRKKGALKVVDNIIMFDRSEWAELRRVRGGNRGLPLDVNQNGTIWIGDRFLNKDLKIFVRRK